MKLSTLPSAQPSALCLALCSLPSSLLGPALCRARPYITAWGVDADADPHSGAESLVRVVMRGIEAVSLQQHNKNSTETINSCRGICFNLEWTPDIDLLEANGEAEACIRRTLLPLETPALEEAAAKQLRDVQLACAI
ncbi:hypothetical protein CTA1_3126 [Colletotrichum tanaceti]|uniref:Uncharacterized protein n=1 Tax=Colletotrichum tanaceti TaxID=1306861 RepID=A0A4U6XVU1_9PEZI|nr:hypothetical protein CTA1_3126 [Colletotrichum tanaceti]